MVFHYLVFNHGFKYQDSVFDGYHDLLIQWINISNIGIATVNLLIIVVLLMTLANMAQLVYQKMTCFMIVGIYKKCIPTKSISKIECTIIILTV